MPFRFGNYILDGDRRELHRDGVLLALEPQVFDLLVHLVHNRDRVVSKDELIKHVWAGRIVSDATLDSRVRTVRLAVGDTGAKQSMIRTIPRRGIRFTADVECEPLSTTTAPTLAKRLPSIAPPIGSSKPSIAVLPFAHKGDDTITEHFCDGITQDIITNLTRSRALLVMAGGLASAGKPGAVRPITDRSGCAAYVLEGQVRESCGWVRVTVRLIEAEVGAYIWAVCFDRDRAGIQAAHADIANAVCASVMLAISTYEQRRAIQKSRTNLNAWEAYQRGLSVASSHGRQEISQAMAYFRQATELDPSFAEPHALLSRFHLIETHRGDSEVFCDALARAESEAIASLRLDPGYSTAHAVLSGVLDYHGDQVGAFEEAERGIALNSGDPWSWFSKGHLLVYGGQWAEGRSALKAALRLQPGGPIVPAVAHHLIVGHFMERDFTCAEAACRQVIRSQPEFERPHVFLAATLGHLSRYDEAAAVLQTAMSFSSSYLAFLTRGRPPYFRAEDYELILHGLRMAGWCGDPGFFAAT